MARGTGGRTTPSVRRARGTVARDGTLTFVFTDIESSTATGSRLGDVAFHDLLTEHKAALRDAIGPHGGRVVKDQGDGLMVVFPSAHSAIHSAIDMQQAVAGGELRLKVGINSGEAVGDIGDYQGLAVTIAARLEKLASADEILISDVSHRLAGFAGDLRFGQPRHVELKGVPGVHEVWPVLWRDDETPAPPVESGATITLPIP